MMIKRLIYNTNHINHEDAEIHWKIRLTSHEVVHTDEIWFNPINENRDSQGKWSFTSIQHTHAVNVSNMRQCTWASRLVQQQRDHCSKQPELETRNPFHVLYSHASSLLQNMEVLPCAGLLIAVAQLWPCLILLTITKTHRHSNVWFAGFG